ncbi:MAG: glycosyltransferase [Flavobacteriales bacterium]|nr:glycosyltransferase [Flavobacteriales bacterium]
MVNRKQTDAEVEISVVIPVFGSEEVLPKLDKQLHRVLNVHPASYELIYVDDCGPDRSMDVLEGLRRASPMTVRVVSLKNNVGQWVASLAGISKARGRIIVTIDDDLQYDPEDVLSLINTLDEGGYQVVYGIPKAKGTIGRGGPKMYAARVGLVDRILRKNRTESFKAFRRELMLESGFLKTTFHFEAHAKRALEDSQVGYVDVKYRPRTSGKSGYPFVKKIALLLRFGPEYYRSSSWFVASMLFLLVAVLAVVLPVHLVSFRVFMALTFVILSVLTLIISYRNWKRGNAMEQFIIKEYR